MNPIIKHFRGYVKRLLLKARLSFIFRVRNPLVYARDFVSLKARGADRVPHRVLLLSDALEATSEEQFNAFIACREELRDKHQLITLHLSLKDALSFPNVLQFFDKIIVKMSFRTSREDAVAVVQSLKNAAGTRPLIYFDGDDDLCIQWPDILENVDLYVKKHAFRDRNQYKRTFVGKSNLTDFVHHQFGYSFADNPVSAGTRPVAVQHLSKIVVGLNLASDSKILSLRKSLSEDPPAHQRESDIIFRGNIPADWMGYLRNDVEAALKPLSDYRIIMPRVRVAPAEYYREMQTSKLCISPFGYGEICWRDFEAIMCGCLLVKPDMSHIETNPNIFAPFQTYVPIKWDFSDLAEKCAYYLEHEDERERIVVGAFQVLKQFYNDHGVVKSVLQILSFEEEVDALDREIALRQS